MATTSRPSRERILDYLAQHGGRITSADGRGLTTALARAAGYRDLSPLNAMLARLEQEGDIRREVRGRRTYAISLTRRGRSSRISAPATTTRPASARGRSASTRDRGAARSGVDLPRLAGALSEELVALRRDQDGLTRRVVALERALVEDNGSRKPGRPRSARRSQP